MNTKPTPAITHDAANPDLNYYGRWHVGRTAVSINSGSLVEFVYRGNACDLVFDVRGFTHFPAIFVQVDNGPIARTALSREVSAVSAAPQSNAAPSGPPPSAVVASGCHLVRFWVGSHSLYQTRAAGQQWTTLVGGCRFAGLALPGGDPVSVPANPRQIEFLGDSITQGLRLLFAGVDDDTGQQIPYANWPQYVADLFGLKPIVTGFGGQGLTTAGTCGAPPANEALPYVYSGVAWEPSVKPEAVVIYQGTNDGVAPAVFESRYTAYLAAVRRMYPSAVIAAVCPHNKTNYAAAIRNAAGALSDNGILFLDYSSGVIPVAMTCDGCHLNPGGAVALAARLAADIGARVTSGD